MRILAVCGSLQERSGNLALLRAAAASAPRDVDVVLFDGLADLPFFNPDLEATQAPGPVEKWRAALAECDAVLVACPEYGHSLPGVVKNAIDWVIGSGELHRKPVAITASVPHVERGRRGLDALRQTLLAIDADIVGYEPIARGEQADAEIRALLDALVARVSSATV